jgi:hypothetical protein
VCLFNKYELFQIFIAHFIQIFYIIYKRIYCILLFMSLLYFAAWFFQGLFIHICIYKCTAIVNRTKCHVPYFYVESWFWHKFSFWHEWNFEWIYIYAKPWPVMELKREILYVDLESKITSSTMVQKYWKIWSDIGTK